MKKYFLLAVLIALVAGSLMAQTKIGMPPTPPPPRISWVQEFTNCAQAIAPPTVIATGDDEIPCFQVMIAYSNYTPPPKVTAVKWHEFTATALTTDSWCSPNATAGGGFTSPAQCAAFWFNRLSPAYEHMGLATTSERTFCLWWLY